jgi:Ca2+-binding RTX toxin-like protein
LPAWLSFNSATRSFSGTPPLNFNGTLALKVTATDAGGLSAASNFALAITPVNDAPIVAAPVADRTATQGTALSFALPTGTFTDVDNPTLALAATGLPAWLSFNAATGTFTGTPGAANLGTFNITVTATDSGGLSVSDVFAITVTGSGGNVINGTNRDDDLHGTAGNDTINGLGGNDELEGCAGNDRLNGDAGNDELEGGSGDDQLYGGTGNDKLYGDDGNDQLFGEAGNDSLSGGYGNDLINGGLGTDLLRGGAGSDTFVFSSLADSVVGSARDVIQDFVHLVDRIDLSGIDANNLVAGDQAFNFIGGSAFHRIAGELRYSGGLLSGDVNGDGIADFELQLVGMPVLTGTDFII